MYKHIILGILQGLFEWLPISSEGVVALASNYLIKDLNAIDVALFLHLGTILAAVIYFRKEWIEVLTFKNMQLVRFLVIATIVSLAIGYPIYQLVQNAVMGTGLLFITGIGLLFTAYFHKAKKNLGIRPDVLAVIAGALQGMAIIPGFSRSGSTIFGLSLGDLEPEKTLKLSYMMSVPVVLASSFYLFLNNPAMPSQFLIPATASFLTGILTLHFLMNFAKRIDFFRFALVFSFLCFAGAAFELLINL